MVALSQVSVNKQKPKAPVNKSLTGASFMGLSAIVFNVVCRFFLCHKIMPNPSCGLIELKVCFPFVVIIDCEIE